MKVNQKYLEAGLILVMIAVCYFAYSFGYKSYIDKAKQLENQSKNVEARINTLNEKITHKAEWEADIAKADAFTDVLFTKYGPGNSIEKSIMLLVDMTNRTGTTISSMSLGESSLIYQSSAVNENGAPKERLYSQQMTISIRNSYTGVKRLFDYINNYPERMNVETFSLAYDAPSGSLTGSMVVNIYSVVDGNHTYVAPVIEDIQIGNPNIFKSNYVDPNAVLLDENGNPIDENGNPLVETEDLNLEIN